MIAPPPNLTVSQWADKFRRLSREYASEPGRWKTDRAPYQRGIMDCVTDSRVRRVTVMAAAQTGKTEIELNIFGYLVDVDPCSILWVWPSEDLGESFSKERLAPTIQDTPVLREKIRDVKSRSSDNTILSKKFPGGYVAIVGANSPKKLASRPVRALLMDEIDGYPASAGTEGDPRKLAEKRVTTYWNSLVIQTSTPTITDLSPIDSEWKKGTMERWYWPCPKCGKDVNPRWELLIWQGREENPVMRCPHCGKESEEQHWKRQNGRWIADHPERRKHRSFHLTGLISPWISWPELVEEYIEAKESGGIQALQVFYNTRLARTWDAIDSSIELETLEQHKEEYKMPPLGVLVLTAGVDIQDDRLEVEVVGWGIGYESWGIAYRVFVGNPARDMHVWSQLDDLLKQQWIRADGQMLSVACVCIDSGGHATSQVYRFTRLREDRRVYAVKGRGGAGVPQVSKPSRAGREKALLFTLGVDQIKALLIARLKVEEPGPDYCHWPASEETGYDEKYFDGLTAERRVVETTSQGARKVRWVKRTQKSRNEPLDCRVYATAAIAILSPNFERLAGVAKKQPTKKRRILSEGVTL